MKARILICVTLVILTAAVGFDIFTRHLTRLDDAWQYRVTTVPDDQFANQMNQLGANGWEVVSARRASNGAEYKPVFSYEMILKRRATPERLAELYPANPFPLPEKK